MSSKSVSHPSISLEALSNKPFQIGQPLTVKDWEELLAVKDSLYNVIIEIKDTSNLKGTGYGREAVGWLIEQGFRACNLHRIECGVLSSNVAAIKLYESLGFSIEWRQQEEFWMQGQWIDRNQMGLLENDWKALKENRSA
ncbi:acyl-CoA N-acyltransferase [Atractiella rhizophila]|nr:acyl-CoA N-acyltransferase [Atractiella rhizophila]